MDDKIYYTADDAMHEWHKYARICISGQNLIDIDLEFFNRGEYEYTKWIEYYSRLLSAGIIKSDVQLSHNAIII